MTRLWAAVALLTACAREEPPLVSALRDAGPVTVAHRGGMDLAPESTVEAFQRAWDAGAHALELDVRYSADGVPYVFHDDTLDRTTEGEGSVFGLTWDTLSALDAGYDWTRDGGETYPFRGQGLTVPALEEVFAGVPDGIFNLDIKSREPDSVDAVVALIQDHGLEERVCVGSFDDAIGLSFQEQLPGSCTYYSEGFARWHLLGDLIPLESAPAPRFDLLEVPVMSSGIRIVTERFVERAHARDQLVWVWTVNDPDEMDELLSIGVDGFITDEVVLSVAKTGAR
ncbi:MAG: glycerophosphodiester phosphodiesterase [Myxococcota bacterium]